MHSVAEQKGRIPPGKLASARHAVAFADPATCVEYQSESKIGGRFGEYAGRIRDDDVSRFASRKIDVVDPDCVVGDDGEMGCALEQSAVDTVGHEGDDSRLVGNPFPEFIL